MAILAMRGQEDRSHGANPSMHHDDDAVAAAAAADADAGADTDAKADADADADADDNDDAKRLTGDTLHGNFGNEGPRRGITRANPTQSEARSGKKTVRQLSSRGGGGGIHRP